MRPFSFAPGATLVILLLCIAGLAFSWYIPQDAQLDTFEIAAGFQIEQIAAEPLIADPVAMEVDEYGNIFVAEMPGYPLDVSGKGRIRQLRDEDGDGQIDGSHIFADNIVLPTGLMRWKNGLLVTSPPDVLYLEDTDGDGVAETRRVVLTGFARSNPQHNFNKPLYGLDNWIYLANNGIIWTSAYKAQFGDQGQDVHFPDAPNGPRLGRNANDRNVRFKPDTHELASLAGRSQFGHTFDTWGHHFLVSNATPQYHEVIAARYLARNEALTTRMSMQYTPAYGRNTAIFPITRNPEHQLLTDRGMITSAAGITYYQGDLFPELYQHTTFIAEPVHNLVHVLKVHEKGATFEATRLEARKEFLASTDSWFRPVNHYVGPDGALYVVDYHRKIVEHPEWMDDETARSEGLQEGTDQGRLYRITPEGTAPAAWMNNLDLGNAPTAQLVEHLQSPNIWWRRTAQRLLVDQQDAAAVDPLKQLLGNSEVSGAARVHALWTLDGLRALTPDALKHALLDPVPGVRENAIVLAEMYVEAHPELWDALLAMQQDPSTRVRFQLLCTLGYLDTARGRDARQQLLTQDIDDPWMQLAWLTAESKVDNALLSDLLPALTATETDGRKTFLGRLADLIAGQGAPEELDQLAAAALAGPAPGASWWQGALLAGMADGLPNSAGAAHNLLPLRNMLLARFYQEETTALRPQLLALIEALPATADATSESIVTMATQLMQDPQASPTLRAQSVALAAHLGTPDIAQFTALIDPAQPVILQQAAIRALDAGNDDAVTATLIDAWPVLTTEVRNTALEVLMHSQDRMAAILNAVEAGIVQPSAIGWNRTVRLMRDTSGPLKELARNLLSEPAGVRDQVVASYYASLDLDGNANAGQAAFERVCSTCHQVGGDLGTAYGPDLATVRHWSARALLAKILKPQSTIADGYGLWSVRTTDGQTYTGLIDTGAPSSIQIKQQGSPPIVVARDDIESLQSLNATAMPAGLEQQLDRQEMADLIAFLRFN